MENHASQESALVDQALSWLRSQLPQTWEVGAPGRRAADGGLDNVVELRPPHGAHATLLIEAKRRLEPRDVAYLLTDMTRALRALAGDAPVLVVAPWLSPRTRERLRDERLNYLDLTGNAWVRLENPPVVIQTVGAAKDPEPQRRATPTLRGARAGRLIRLLTDVRPPYTVSGLTEASGLSQSYVSRLLDRLDDEALIERARRGIVVNVDVLNLIRRWAEDYAVFTSNGVTRWLSRSGARTTLEPLTAITETRWAVTGSFAAVRLAPVAAPALLAVYTDQPTALSRGLGLLPTDDNPDVVLLDPFDPVVWERPAALDGLPAVAPSQIAVDCLTGNGRMPAEGEEVLAWLSAHPDWQAPALTAQSG